MQPSNFSCREDTAAFTVYSNGKPTYKRKVQNHQAAFVRMSLKKRPCVQPRDVSFVSIKLYIFVLEVIEIFLDFTDGLFFPFSAASSPTSNGVRSSARVYVGGIRDHTAAFDKSIVYNYDCISTHTLSYILVRELSRQVHKLI